MKSFEKNEPKGSFSEKQIKILMRSLKAANNLTIDGGPNVLQDFCNTNFMNNILYTIKSDSTYQKMKEKASKMQNYTPRYTNSEKDMINANKYLRSGNLTRPTVEEEFEKCKRHSSNAQLIMTNYTPEQLSRRAIWRVSARQDGFKPGEPSKPDEQGRSTISLNDRSVSINLEDLKQLGESKLMKTIIVNGRKFEAMQDVSSLYEKGEK